MVAESKRTILVIEDNELNREIIRTILSDNYQVLEAENGQVGLNMLREEDRHISLILLDIQMPVMNGYEFLDAVRDDERIGAIPIIVTTSSGSREDELCSLEKGASDFVTKPYEPDIVLKRVESMIRLSEASQMLSNLEYDALTGVYSREFFYYHARYMLDANPTRAYDLICCDIESFKLINDRHGTAVGDQILRTLADLLRAHLKPNEICGRLAADVFAVLVEHTEGEGRATTSGPEGISKFFPVQNVVIKFGAYNDVPRNCTIDQLCDRARLAIESIKNHYNEYYAVYNQTIRDRRLREQTIVDCMETALSEHQFRVYFQPKHGLLDGRISGAEALVRWIHPELGFMNPGEFIPIFERNGFIVRLDAYVWAETLRTIRDWMDRGIPVVPVSVNVSRVDFEEPQLVERIAQLVESYDVPKSLFHLEVTESAYTDHPSRIVDVITRLRQKGFIVELDDFGAGYSSMNILSDLALDILKLDMSFVKRILSERQRMLAATVINLANDFQMDTVAEGIETQAQEEILRKLGCTYGQGYLYARPLPKEEFEAYLTRTPET